MRTSHAAAAAIAALLVVLLAGAPARAQSGARADAFSAAVAVADRDEPERRAAYAAALRRVLLDNAPDRTLMNRDDVRAALLDASAYVETFRFEVPESGSGIAPGTPVTDAVRRSGEAVGLLRVRFDRERVLGLVAASGAPPPALAGVGSVLVWLLIEDGERIIAGSDPAALKVRERVREIAGGAGVTVAFGDAEGLDPEALRALDAAAIETASLRYATDAVLVGRLSRGSGPPAVPVPGASVDASGIDLRGTLPPVRAPRATQTGWNGEWLRLATLSGPDGSDADEGGAGLRASAAPRTVTRAERLDDVLRGGLAWLLPDLLGGAGTVYAYGGGGDPAEGLVWVGSIDSVADYARTMALFESVVGIESVYPRSVVDGAGVFVVRPRRALEGIAGAAARTDWLRRGSPPVGLVDPVRGASARVGTDTLGRDASASRRGGLARRGDGRGSDRPAGPETFAELARQVDLAFDVLP